MVAVEVLHLVLSAAAENLDSAQKSKRRELGIPANREPADLPTELPLLGEGGDAGHIEPGKSVSFASLEVCLCILVSWLFGCHLVGLPLVQMPMAVAL